MEEFKGTPGPWFIKPVSGATVEGDLNVIQTEPATSKGYHIGYAATWGDNSDTAVEADFNARLIAAAPELLEALQRFYRWYDDIYGDDCDYTGEHPIALAKAAISKALGK